MVVTGTRAEYGLLKNVLHKIEASAKLELQLIVTGTHLSTKFGNTINEIEADGFKPREEIAIIQDNEKPTAIATAMSIATQQLAKTIERLQPNLILILGDRYEMLTVATVATIMNVPIAHIAGGEVTNGSIDEQIRHAITKMAHIHFAQAKEYADNIKKMGEEHWRIHNVGALGIENIRNQKLLTKEELSKQNIEVDNQTILMTYHATTQEPESLKNDIAQIKQALEQLNDLKFIITYPNADNGGLYIIEQFKLLKDITLVESLGMQKYLSVMKYCGLVLGNSSSALIEAPYFNKPVINIGNRQDGRMMAKNIVQVETKCNSIVEAVRNNIGKTYANIESLYEYGNTSSEIVKIIENLTLDKTLRQKKLVWN